MSLYTVPVSIRLHIYGQRIIIVACFYGSHWIIVEFSVSTKKYFFVEHVKNNKYIVN